jgi:2-desacetyl-2-hydroxyethyl bacteriochlorophyllide A dehydrogenase
VRAVRHHRGEPRVRLEQVPVPTAGDGDVLVEVAAAGLCGTDVSLVFGGHGDGFRRDAVTLGHEIAGHVAAVGAVVDGWSVGDAVVVSPIVTCGQCSACIHGEGQVCEGKRVIGIDLDGGLAECVVVPAANLVRLPDGIPPEVGAILTDAVATPFHALVDRAALRPGESIAVFGVGGLGQHAIQLARLTGAGQIVAVDVRPEPLALALGLGADLVIDAGITDVAETIRSETGGRGVNVAADFTGAAVAIEAAIEALASGGRLVVCGIGPERAALPPTHVFVRKEISVIASYGFRRDTIELLVQLVAAGRLSLQSSISHVVGLRDVDDALRMLRDKRDAPRRVVVRP